MKKKILIGMSGGVDSSVAAALLCEQGHDVTGVTLRLWSENSSGGSCGISREAEDARQVCKRLGIPHLVLDRQEAFREHVIEYFIREYRHGRTPNPCVACNRHIKFGEMLRYALENGFDGIATGHYAKIVSLPNGRLSLLRASGIQKDQSYVLYSLSQEQLRRLYFPIGELTKDQVREKARSLGLAVHSKPDSQEICFIPDHDYAAFLQRSGVPLPGEGDFLSQTGEVLGRHGGIWRYTVGQRKGLGVSFGRPMFVLGIDPDSNTVTLGEAGSEFSSSLTVKGCNWMAVAEPAAPIAIAAKLRYSATPSPALITPLEGERARLDFDTPVRAVTPGQAAVFYDGGLLLGGGIIE